MLNGFEEVLKIIRQFPTNAFASEKLNEILNDLAKSSPSIKQEKMYMQGLLELGNFYFRSAQFKAAIRSYDSLKLLYDQVDDTPFYSYGIIYMNKGLCYMYSSSYTNAEESFKRALLCNEDIVGDKAYNQLRALVYQNLGCLYELMGKLDDAKESYEKVLKIK